MPYNPDNKTDQITGTTDNWQTPADYADTYRTLNHALLPPKDFRVTLAADKQHLLFTINDVQTSPTRQVIDEYKIWFAPVTLLADSATIQIPAVAARVFAGAELAATMSASGKAGDISQESDRRFVGVAGWFFATAANEAGTQSRPTLPVVNPTASTAGDSAVPPDVTGAQVTLLGEQFEGKAYVRVAVTALVPSPIGSFAGYQIYIKGYRYNPLIEEGPFIGLTSQEGGDSLSGSFLLSPDVPSGYSDGLATFTSGTFDIDGVGTNWNTAWAGERFVEAWLLDLSGDEFLSRWHISTTTSPTHITAASPAPGGFIDTTCPYVIYDPAQQTNNTIEGASGQDFVRISHNVTFYFVAVSKAGTRRTDVENSPRVVFKFGLNASLTKPFNPVNLVALTNLGSTSRNGASVNLTWNLVQIAGTPTDQIDSTVAHFNIYRVRAGTVGTPDWTVKRPNQPFATIRYNDAMQNLGAFAWTDRSFNTDPLIDSAQQTDGWDFDQTDPAQYVYWVTSVNVQARENLTAYWSHVSATNATTTLTVTGGDPATADWIGETITINGEDYTVEDVDTGTQVVTFDPAFLDPTSSYQSFIGPTTGRVTLVGNSGSENDPTIYRDNFYNRVFNSQFIGTDGSSLQAHDTAYGPANNAADGQPTFKYFFTGSEYIVGGTGVAGVPGEWSLGAATAPPAAMPTANDRWSIWESYLSTGGTAGTFTAAGEIEIDPTAHTADDFSAISQFVEKGAFLRGENLVLAILAKTASAGASTSGYLLIQIVRYDARDFSNAAYTPSQPEGVERDVGLGGAFNLTTLTTDYTQFKVLAKLSTADPAVSVTANGTTTLTAPNSDFSILWMGAYISVNGEAFAHEIQKVTGGTGIDDNTTITLGSAVSQTGTFDAVVCIQGVPPGTVPGGYPTTIAGPLPIPSAFTHYQCKFGINGEWSEIITLKQPMVNGGLLGAPWTAQMNSLDWPGGASQTGGSDTDPNDPVVGCVPVGTPVETVDGPRPVELCVAGTEIWSYGNGKLVRNRVASLNLVRVGTMYRFTTAAHHEFRCSSTHPIAIWKQGAKSIYYRDASDMQIGDVIYRLVGGQVVKDSIVGIDFETGTPVHVYSITAERSPRNLFFDGVCAHNKSAAERQS